MPDPLDNLIRTPGFQQAPAAEQRDMASQADPSGFGKADAMTQDYFLTSRAFKLGMNPYTFTDHRQGFPVGTMSTIQQVETGGEPNPDIAVSSTGVRGRMQMTNTAADEVGMPAGPLRTDPLMQVAGAGNFLSRKVQAANGDFLGGVALYGGPQRGPGPDYITKFQRAWRGGTSWSEAATDMIRSGLARTQTALDQLTAPPGQGPGAMGRVGAGLTALGPAAMVATGGTGAIAPLAGGLTETIARHAGAGEDTAQLANTVGQVGAAALPMAARTAAGIVTQAAPRAAYRLGFSPRAQTTYQQLAQGLTPRVSGGPGLGSRFVRALRPVADETIGQLLSRARTGDSRLLNAFAHVIRTGVGFAAGHMMGEGKIGAILAELPALFGAEKKSTLAIAGGIQHVLEGALENPLVAPFTRAMLSADPSAADYGRASALLLQHLFPQIASLLGQEAQGNAGAPGQGPAGPGGIALPPPPAAPAAPPLSGAPPRGATPRPTSSGPPGARVLRAR